MKKVEDVQEVQVVEEVTKLTQEEFERLTSLNQDFMNITMDLGALEVQSMAIEDRKKSLKEIHGKKLIESQEFTSSLREKYGDININVNSGEFVKAENVE